MPKYIDEADFPTAAEINAAALSAHRAKKADMKEMIEEGTALDGGFRELQSNKLIAVVIDALATSDTTPDLSGKVNDPNAALALVVDGQNEVPTNDGDLTWSLAGTELTALGVGTYDVEVTATNADNDNSGEDASEDELEITA